MIPVILVGSGTLSGLIGAALLHYRWKSPAFPRPLLLLGWLGIGFCIWAWSAAVSADVGPAFATLVVMAAGLGLILMRADLRPIMPFPATRKAVRDTSSRPNWKRGIARILTCIIVAPLVGLSAGMLVWSLAGGHAATRFTTGVFVFLIGYAVLQIWALGSEKPWRTLGLMTLLGSVLAALVYVRL